MANRVDLTLNENNDEVIRVALTTNVPHEGTVLDLTGKDLEAFVKVSAAAADTDPGTWKGTSVAGDITVTDASNGLGGIAVPRSAVTTTQGWWRLDVVSSGLRKTAVYGSLRITDL